ncbi:MAG: hypothetical protein ACREEC_01655, partial [Thermoplasmata archaeon]
MQHEFAPAVTSNCILCLVHHHGLSEDLEALPWVAQFDGALVERLFREHRDAVTRLVAISKPAEELHRLADPADRIQEGAALN